jgi:hypothetical protein
MMVVAALGVLLTAASMAGAANYEKHDKLLRPLCTAGHRGHYVETFYVSNPRRKGVNAELNTLKQTKEFRMPSQSHRYVEIKIKLGRRADASLYFNRHFIDRDNVHVKRCIVVD